MIRLTCREFAATLALAGVLVSAGGCETAPTGDLTSAPDLTVHEALEPLAWLAGTWVSESAPDLAAGASWTEETWTAPAGNAMLGVNRSMAGATMAFFEYMRLQVMPDDSVVYFAAPAGRHPASAFPMIDATATRLVFENAEHDFPQRIVYDLRPDGTLLMSISSVDPAESDRTVTWTMMRGATP